MNKFIEIYGKIFMTFLVVVIWTIIPLGTYKLFSEGINIYFGIFLVFLFIHVLILATWVSILIWKW